jgi:hypothetical protein
VWAVRARQTRPDGERDGWTEDPAQSRKLRPRSSRRHERAVPFTCEACGRGNVFPDLIPAVGDVLQCPQRAAERPFARPPLLIWE